MWALKTRVIKAEVQWDSSVNMNYCVNLEHSSPDKKGSELKENRHDGPKIKLDSLSYIDSYVSSNNNKYFWSQWYYWLRALVNSSDKHWQYFVISSWCRKLTNFRKERKNSALFLLLDGLAAEDASGLMVSKEKTGGDQNYRKNGE